MWSISVHSPFFLREIGFYFYISLLVKEIILHSDTYFEYKGKVFYSSYDYLVYIFGMWKGHSVTFYVLVFIHKIK